MKKRYLSGLLVLALALAVFGCNPDPSENTDPKIITITDITGDIQSFQLRVANSMSMENGQGNADTVAEGQAAVEDGSATIELFKDDGTAWTGTGSYYVMLQVGENSFYIYTDGHSFSDLDITGTTAEDIAKLPKFSITETVSTIGFAKFRAASELMGEQ